MIRKATFVGVAYVDYFHASTYVYWINKISIMAKYLNDTTLFFFHFKEVNRKTLLHTTFGPVILNYYLNVIIINE